jgi:hypothetical protein
LRINCTQHMHISKYCLLEIFAKYLPKPSYHSFSIYTGEHTSSCFKSSCLLVNELITPMSHNDLIGPAFVACRIHRPSV